MILNPDTALKKFEAIVEEFNQFCRGNGEISEADTRANFLDRVFIEVLGWPRGDLRREDHVESGFMDYTLKVLGKDYVVAEAKREGKTFIVPSPQNQRTYQLDGVLTKDAHIAKAITQVRGYCDDAGIRYAITTNGVAWIIFRAIRDDSPWKKGKGMVFSSPAYIINKFSQFWNLLSYESICAGSLDQAFGSAITTSRHMHRVIGRIFNADLPLLRNQLNEQLQSIIKAFFEDIADKEEALFKSCYVHSQTMNIVAHDLDVVIKDSIPKFVAEVGGVEIYQSDRSAGAYGDAISSGMVNTKHELYLLLGGIGSGKWASPRMVGATD